MTNVPDCTVLVSYNLNGLHCGFVRFADKTTFSFRYRG